LGKIIKKIKTLITDKFELPKKYFVPIINLFVQVIRNPILLVDFLHQVSVYRNTIKLKAIYANNVNVSMLPKNLLADD